MWGLFAVALLAARVTVTVRAAGYERVDAIAEVEIEPGSGGIRVVDAATGKDAPFQLDGRTLTILMTGVTKANAARRYHVASASVPDRTPALLRATEVDYEGQRSIRVQTPAATYTYHKEGAGFARIVDADGTEWIGYRPRGRSAGAFRGIPNLGEFAHPGYTGPRGSKSTLVAQGPLKVTIRSERHDGLRALVWDIFPSHARMTVLKTDKPYWFLYEGTPGGRLDLERGFYVTAGGRRRSLAEAFAGDIAGPEWLYFGVPDAKQVLYLVNHQDDTAPDQYWPMEGSMTVFGFGREYRCCGMYLNQAPARFTIGFAPNASHEEVSRRVQSSWRDLIFLLTP